MIQKHIVISMIAPVTVVEILMLAMLAAISPTNQAFAYSSYHKGHHSPHINKPGNGNSGRTYTTPHISKAPGRTYSSM
ncbi:MAG: hypothetical protein WBZ36_27425 [Candidatus Nitrosopolaris sp.]